jgi:hypothetical protein
MTSAVIVTVAIVRILRVMARQVIVAHRGDTVVVLIMSGRVIAGVCRRHVVVVLVMIGRIIFSRSPLIVRIVVCRIVLAVIGVSHRRNVVNSPTMFLACRVVMDLF